MAQLDLPGVERLSCTAQCANPERGRPCRAPVVLRCTRAKPCTGRVQHRLPWCGCLSVGPATSWRPCSPIFGDTESRRCRACPVIHRLKAQRNRYHQCQKHQHSAPYVKATPFISMSSATWGTRGACTAQIRILRRQHEVARALGGPAQPCCTAAKVGTACTAQLPACNASHVHVSMLPGGVRQGCFPSLALGSLWT